jgi:hypothetical protein
VLLSGETLASRGTTGAGFPAVHPFPARSQVHGLPRTETLIAAPPLAKENPPNGRLSAL